MTTFNKKNVLVRTTLALGLCASLLTGCGFHLRGETLIPRDLGTIYVGGDSLYGDISHSIRNELRMADITVAKTSSEANYKIILLSQRANDRTLSLGDGARAAQYILLEDVTIEIRDRDNNLILGPETLNERRILNYSSDTPQDSSQEQKLLRAEMKKSLARKIARQLRVVANKKPEAS